MLFLIVAEVLLYHIFPHNTIGITNEKMAKKYFWEIPEEETNIETGEPTGNTITHEIEVCCSNLTGKIVISIDGTSFDISEKPFSLKKVEQMFRLGEMPAIIRFDKKCIPIIVVDNETYEPKK